MSDGHGKLLSDRFWGHVDRRGPNECWPWSASRAHGYGQFGLRAGFVVHAHRVAYALEVGPIAEGLAILHRCDVRECCNPAHLVAGTWRDNSLDMVAKRRHFAFTMPERYARGLKNGKHTHPESRLIGRRNPSCTTTIETIEAVVRDYKTGDRQVDIATRYGIGQSQVSRIIRGEISLVERD